MTTKFTINDTAPVPAKATKAHTKGRRMSMVDTVSLSDEPNINQVLNVLGITIS